MTAVILLIAGAPPEFSLDAGALRAHSSPTIRWRVTFTDAAGQPVLARGHRYLGSGPSGPLGFRTASGWVARRPRARACASGATASPALVDTNDPLGRQLAVRLTRDAEGVIALTARIEAARPTTSRRSASASRPPPDERFFGFGERANARRASRRRGRELRLRRPLRPGRRDLIGAVLPPPGFRDRDDATYFPIPWLLSSRGYGVLVDNDETAYHRLGDRAPGRVERRGRRARRRRAASPRAPSALALRVFAGPTPADALRRFTARVGRQPRAAAPWVFGPVVPARRLARRRSSRSSNAARRRRAGVGRADLLSTIFRAATTRAGEPQRTRGDARARRRGHDLLQPDDLRGVPAGVRARRRHRRAHAHGRRRAVHLPLRHLARLPRRPVRLHRPGRARALPRAARATRSTTATTAGWRTSASTRRSTLHARRPRRHRRAQPLSGRLPLRGVRAARVAAAADRALPALRMDRRRALRAGGVERRSRRRTGASTASPRW